MYKSIVKQVMFYGSEIWKNKNELVAEFKAVRGAQLKKLLY